MGPNKRTTKVPQAVWIVPVLILLLVSIQIGHGADDSNSGDFSINPPTSPPTRPDSSHVISNSTGQNPSDLPSGLEKLNRDTRNLEVDKLVSQMRDHNYTQAQSTLQDLQNQLQDPQSPASNNLSSGLKDVLNSASCSQTGCSVNWSQVKDMIKPDTTDQIGVPKGLAGNSPGSAADQLSTLSHMAAKADPAFSAAMNFDIAQIMQFLNSPNDYNGPLQNLQLPSIPNLGGNSGPTDGGASGGTMPPVLGGIGGIPGIGNSMGIVMMPVILILAGFLAYTLLRKKQVGTSGNRTLGRLGIGSDSGLPYMASLDPTDPRHSIILSFRRAVMLMFGRGVSKLSFETHREFSSKCEVRPEKPFVGRVSSLYERAMFSGRRVTAAHAEDARHQVTSIEECEPKTGKE